MQPKLGARVRLLATGAVNSNDPNDARSVAGPRKIYRLSRRGNRRLNHAIHMAAVTQIRHRHSPGRAPATTASWPRARPRKRRCAR